MRNSCRLALLSWATQGVVPFCSDSWNIRTCSSLLPSQRAKNFQSLEGLSGDYLENDLVAVQKPTKNADNSATSSMVQPRLCVVRPDGTVAPLCQHEDDVETDLFLDPRCDDDPFWTSKDAVTDHAIKGTYGEGWYGQRPVPSLGGGPGYGASAQEIWSVPEAVLDKLAKDGVELPILDVGIAHGEKARSGSF